MPDECHQIGREDSSLSLTGVSLKSVELFTGAGGLALGVAATGFKHIAVVEWDHDACNTVRLNQSKGNSLVSDWPLHEMDIANFNFASIKQDIELLGGGPPCQAFSLAGKTEQRVLHRHAARSRVAADELPACVA